jgi:hypothetical protein
MSGADVVSASSGVGEGGALTREESLARDLALYRKYPNGMALIDRESVLYQNEKKDDPENTFIYPVVEAYAKAETKDLDIDNVMKDLEVLAALSRAKDPEPCSIFKIGTQRFALFPELAGLFESSSCGVERLHDCWRLSEFLQLPKELSARVNCAREAEALRAQEPGFTSVDVEKEPGLASLLKLRLDTVSANANSIKVVRRGSGMQFNYITLETDLDSLCRERAFLEGAFGVPAERASGGIMVSFDAVLRENVLYLAGRAFGGHDLPLSMLELVKAQLKQQGGTFGGQSLIAVALGGNFFAVTQLQAIGFYSTSDLPAVFQHMGKVLPKSLAEAPK